MQKKDTEAARIFYQEALKILNESKIPYLLAGAFALKEYTGIKRDTKDLDIFCKDTDHPAIIEFFMKKGYKVEITDPRWLAKVWKDDSFVDIIWGTASNIYMVDDSWFRNAKRAEVFGLKVPLLGAEELVYSKLYVQNRERYDGADINHVFLRYGKKLNWHHLKERLAGHWHLLLEQFIQFMFIYPSDIDILPKDLLNDLFGKVKEQLSMPPAGTKVCRGPLIDHTQYGTDIEQWGYKTVTIYTI